MVNRRGPPRRRGALTPTSSNSPAALKGYGSSPGQAFTEALFFGSPRLEESLTPPSLPVFTSTQGNKSASSGTTTTLAWSADGPPAPTIQVQRLGTGTGTPVFISAVALNAGGSTNPGPLAITVPADAQGVLVFTRGFNGLSLSLSSSFTGTFAVTEDTGTERTAVGRAAVTATGAQTISPVWSAIPTEGPVFIVAFVKGIDNSSLAAWVRAVDVQAEDSVGSAFSRSVASTVADLVLVLDSRYTASNTPPPDEAGWTSLLTQGVSFNAGRLRSANSPGASTTTANTQGDQYRGLALVSLMGVAATWQNVTTGTDFSGPSPLTYTTPTLTLADDGSQWRAVATNTAGSTTSAPMTLTVTAGGGPVVAITSLAAAVQQARTAVASVGFAVQAPASATTSVQLAVQQAQQAGASLAAAVQQAQAAAAVVQVAVQQAASQSTSASAAVQVAQQAAQQVSLAVQRALAASANVSMQVQTATSASAGVDVLVQVGTSSSTGLTMAVQEARAAGAALSLAVQRALTAVASVGVAVQTSPTASAGVSAQVEASGQQNTQASAAVQVGASLVAAVAAAVQLTRTAAAAVSAAVSAVGVAVASLSMAVSISASAAAVTGAAVQVVATTGSGISLVVSETPPEPEVWAPGLRLVAPAANVTAIDHAAPVVAVVPFPGFTAVVPYPGDDMQILKTFEHYAPDRQTYRIDFAAKYLAGVGDTAGTLVAFQADAGITATPEVAVGQPVPSGVVRFRVQNPTGPGPWKVAAQISTAGGDRRTAIVEITLDPAAVFV